MLFLQTFFIAALALAVRNIYTTVEKYVRRRYLTYLLSKGKLVEAAKLYAIICHEETNHRYGKDGKYPYLYHLKKVNAAFKKFQHLIPEADRVIVEAACWLHDTVEDCRQNYNDIKALFGERIADMVYAVSNEKGKNRRERANGKYYAGIKQVPYATFIKLCDRIGNAEHSAEEKGGMFKKYAAENRFFEDKLYYSAYETMFLDLRRTFDLPLGRLKPHFKPHYKKSKPGAKPPIKTTA